MNRHVDPAAQELGHDPAYKTGGQGRGASPRRAW
jgi:hypothetical protein